MKKQLFVVALIILTMLTSSFALATSTVESTDLVNWVLDEYKDEFGRNTGEKIVHNEKLIYGTFSNSAVQNAELGVFIVGDKVDIYLILYEYGRAIVTNPLSQQNYYYDVAILDADNNKYTFNGAIGPGDFRLYFDQNDTILKAIKSGAISFSITKSGSQINRYNFSIGDTKEFANLYSKVKP